MISHTHNTHTLNQLTHMSTHMHHHTKLSKIKLSLSLSLGSCRLCRDEYIIGPFSLNNMAFPTRYVALPYHFQLDEHRVRAGLVENLNFMREIEKRERGRGGCRRNQGERRG